VSKLLKIPEDSKYIPMHQGTQTEKDYNAQKVRDMAARNLQICTKSIELVTKLEQKVVDVVKNLSEALR